MEWVPAAFYVMCVAWCVYFYAGAEDEANDNG
jgi:hypothetical protein